MKNYPIEVDKELIDKLKPFWHDLKVKESEFYRLVSVIEEIMEKRTGIKGIEFFQCDGEYIGIGNAERTMRLIGCEELEEK